MILRLWNLFHLPVQVVRLTENGTRNSRWEGNRVAMRGFKTQGVFKQRLLKGPHLVEKDGKLGYNGMDSCCRAQADPIFYPCRTALIG